MPCGSFGPAYLAPGWSGKFVIGPLAVVAAAPPTPVTGVPASLTARIVKEDCNVVLRTVWIGATIRSRKTVNRTIGSR